MTYRLVGWRQGQPTVANFADRSTTDHPGLLLDFQIADADPAYASARDIRSMGNGQCSCMIALDSVADAQKVLVGQ